MRKIYYLTILVLMTVAGYTQPTRYGNEWIDYSKPYYKVYVNADGIYRIPYTLLDSVIPHLASVSASHFVMFHNGKAVPIYISTGGRAIDTSTYIEFYGKKNIGDIDSVMYPKTGYQPSPYYSCFTDTSTYFLSVNTSSTNPRYIFVNNDTASIHTLTEEPYFWSLANKFYTATGSFSGGTSFYTGAEYIYKSIFDNNEAWGSSWINYSGSPLSINLATPSVYTGSGSPSAVFNMRLFTRSWEPHELKVTFNSTTVMDSSFDNTGGGFCHHTISLPTTPTLLQASNAIQVSELASSISAKENLVMYSEIKYPRMFEFNSASLFDFSLKAASGKRYFRVSQFNDGGTQPLLYDVTYGFIIRSTDTVGVLPKKFVLPAATGDRELYLRADNSTTYTLINRMDTVTFHDYTAAAAQGDYIIITHKVLTADSFNHNYVKDYANYRDRYASPSTGKYDVRIFDIDQIIDQFGYGVRKSGLAIRNFIEYAYDNWAKKPQYLFIIGKGVDYYNIRNIANGSAYNMCLIPTFGSPASDNLLACRRGSNRPLLAIGRLAARTGTDVENYLNKIRIYESTQALYGDPHQNKPEKLWMKQIMHLAGGSTSNEQDLFLGYLSDFAVKAVDTSWGAHVTTIYKNTSAPIDATQINQIEQQVDSGMSLMTFFGHAASTAFDIAVKDPEQWANTTKYPILYSNGCFAGSIHDPTQPGAFGSYSERFVLTPGRAAIAFTATTGASVSTGLDFFGISQYTNFAQSMYTNTWGKCLLNAVDTQDAEHSTDDFSIMIGYDMTLHGDPAIMLNQYKLPDYQIDQSSVFFTPQTIDASVDSFKINVIITNLGKAIKDSIQVTVTRRYPDPDNPSSTVSTTYSWMVKAPYYIDTVCFKMPTFQSQKKGYGQNQFSVFVESQQRITELSESNNGNDPGLNFGFFIESDDVIPVYPYEFSIVPKQGVTLKASTVDPFAPVKTYRIQIDTSALFRHPMAQITVRQSGGVVRWTPPVSLHDSTVYYWRVSRDSISDTLSYKWHLSSFLYLRNEYPGWNQSHYFQYGRDNYPDNVYLDADRKFKFAPTTNKLHVRTGWCKDEGGPNASFVGSNLQWDFNDVNQYRYRMGTCISRTLGYANTATGSAYGFTFAVIDTISGRIWASNNQGNNYGQYGNIHCNTQLPVQYGFDFNLVGTHALLGIPNSQVISNFIDSIPSGNIVLMYAVGHVDYTAIDTNLINKLVTMGATGLRNLASGAHIASPYTFYCMKGNSHFGAQAMGADYTQPLDTSFYYNTVWDSGTYVSTTIGPAKQWGSFHWRWKPSQQNTTDDKQAVDIIGIQANGRQVPILRTSTLDTTLNFINAATYPYIYLRMNVQDDTNHTPAQLSYWRVLYKNVPEAAINPAAHYVISRDTVGLGDSLNVEIALENVSDVAMDSIRSLYIIKSLQTGVQQNLIIKQDSLRASDTLILKFKHQISNSNTNYAGKDRLVLEANPNDQLHQLEEYHFNNFATIDFTGVGDKVNPLLDVTFDGKRIMNGDIVSAKPDILITLRDDNKYLALNDTSMARIYVRYPGQSSPTPINYDNNILTFYPATGNISKRNQARVEFKPTFTYDGVYELLVRDKDASGNFSSNSSTGRWEGTVTNGVYYDYKITFNVITKSMITNVLNYPNPFSTRTQFVFTLTGSVVPDYMKIQIMTVTGKVVKEITKEQLGNIHIGTNLTDYYWDGRDEFGDKLANGVYFYRVITNLNNRQMDHMSSNDYGQFFNGTDIDKYFKHGFGKLVIMR